MQRTKNVGVVQWYLNQANQSRRPAGKLSNSDATLSTLSLVPEPPKPINPNRAYPVPVWAEGQRQTRGLGVWELFPICSLPALGC